MQIKADWIASSLTAEQIKPRRKSKPRLETEGEGENGSASCLYMMALLSLVVMVAGLVGVWILSMML